MSNRRSVRTRSRRAHGPIMETDRRSAVRRLIRTGDQLTKRFMRALRSDDRERTLRALLALRAFVDGGLASYCVGDDLRECELCGLPLTLWSPDDAIDAPEVTHVVGGAAQARIRTEPARTGDANQSAIREEVMLPNVSQRSCICTFCLGLYNPHASPIS